ncbi:MAG TPA: dephospho-CoA kinase, partial [Acidobacteriota bacterium]|nr:dephospho-CoA kinase [Acidobacteriota bacterium]
LQPLIPMLKVGLTGSIAVGKSHVSSYLRELGCHVLDSDQIARTVVEPGTPALADIVETFGPAVLNEDGTLNRQRLGTIIFGHDELRQKLNAIVHPRVHAEQEHQFAEIASRDPKAIVIVDAALLIESGGYRRFDKIVVVWCPKKLQVNRLRNRNQLSRAEALQRINAQMSSQEKRKFADFEINSAGTFEETRHKTEEVYRQLRTLADQTPVT